MRFRPCIDLHKGQVKQIVGGTLTADEQESPVTNYVAPQPPEYFARLYRDDGLEGGHVIKLGRGNDGAAEAALAAYPGGLQVGGGITADNAAGWLETGAAKVIVTSFAFREGRVCWERIRELERAVGRTRLVLDLSCRRKGEEYYVVTDRWQRFTSVPIRPEALADLAEHCSEFLVHGVDVEGKQQGVDEELVRRLGAWTPIPATYAGGIRSSDDLETVRDLGQKRLDVTVGSALDIFGGTGLTYRAMVDLDRRWRAEETESV